MSDELRFADLTEDQLPEVIRIRARSFGLIKPAQQEGWLADAREFVANGRFFGVLAGDRVVAAARIWDFEQWWGGRPVRMAGVAGVVVSPDYRGRGVGSLLMRGVLERGKALGYPISALYPATVVIYRHLGYEFAGGWYKFSFPAADLRLLGGKDVKLRPGTPDDAELLLDLVASVRGPARENGILRWPVDKVRDWLAEDDNFVYVAEDGFTAYTWDGSELRVDELVAGSEATARALWATVGSGSSTAKTVSAYLSPQDPIHYLLQHEAAAEVNYQRWMLRLLDAPAAIAARGWNPAVSVDTEFEIDDVEMPANSGRWRLKVSNGSGELIPASGTTPAPRLSARGVAALFAGTALSTLRASGLASGGGAEDDLRLDAAFAGATPYMLDYF
ncbi:GNAT family N-acetyltransferase [Kribbella deserti]|uniref:Enhanced intracellular survival protein Eis n=1 Tax=Kribbella deserti TaxID=1926257 RepID=A0ABV6QH82_9ACTN